MRKSKYLAIILCLSVILTMLPGMAFALDETKEESKQTTEQSLDAGNDAAKDQSDEKDGDEADENEDKDKESKLVGEQTEPIPEEGYTLIGTMKISEEDVYYEAKLKDDVDTEPVIAVIEGDNVVLKAPIVDEISIRKYDNDGMVWVDLQEADPIPTVDYQWNDTATETNDTYEINNISLMEIATTNCWVSLKINSVSILTSKKPDWTISYRFTCGRIFGTDNLVKENQDVNKVSDGEIFIEYQNYPNYEAYIPSNLSVTLNAYDIIADYVTFMICVDDNFEIMNRTLYEQSLTNKWLKGSQELTSSSKYKITNDGSNDYSLNIYYLGCYIGKISIAFVDDVNLKGMIHYSPYVLPGTRASLKCVIDDELEFDSVKYSWVKTNGGFSPVSGEVLSNTDSLLTDEITSKQYYMCTVTAKVGDKTYTYQEEVEINVGAFNDVGIIKSGDKKSGGTSSQSVNPSFDKYTFTPLQTGKYSVDTNSDNYYICDSEGNLVDIYDSTEQSYILKARNTYYVYIDNRSVYDIVINNLITCDHSCGTKLINVSETYSGDKVCQDCELLIEQGHIITKPDPTPTSDPQKSGTGTGTNTGDSNELYVFISLMLLAMLGAGIIGFKRR